MPTLDTSILVRNPDLVRSDMVVRTTVGDVRDASVLRAALVGVDTVVHAANYIGSDPALCESVNVGGTATLVSAAAAAGVSDLIYVSTTGVYRPGTTRGAREGTLFEAPVSALSTSRLAAERLVLDAGGMVLRPHLVYGTGDRWVVPGLLRLVQSMGSLIENGTARVSVIHVDDLAAAIGALVDAGLDRAAGRVLHAANLAPASVHGMVTETMGALGLDAPQSSVSLVEARHLTTPLGITAHQLGMIAQDRWYDSAALWNQLGTPSPTGFGLNAADIRWYASRLSTPSL